MTFYIDVPDNRLVRYLYLLVFALTDSGFNVKVKANLKLIGNLYDYSDLLLKNKNTFIVFSKPKKDELVLTTLENRYNKSIYLNVNYYSHQINIQDEIIVPLMMHPTNYQKGYYLAVDELRKIKPGPCVFFAGSMFEGFYESELLKDIHNIPSRLEHLKELKLRLGKHLFLPENRNELFSKLEKKNRKIIIANREKAPVYPAEWLKCLAGISFFIAFPGTTIPFCHNIVEAMSVGAIPILAYNKEMPKGLVDGVNCLVYSNLEGFIDKINEALVLDSDKIAQMRNEVISYFDSKLKYKDFGEKLIENLPKQVFINAEYYSLQCLDKELGTNYTSRA